MLSPPSCISTSHVTRSSFKIPITTTTIKTLIIIMITTKIITIITKTTTLTDPMAIIFPFPFTLSLLVGGALVYFLCIEWIPRRS
jgi:hypothetical protein